MTDRGDRAPAPWKKKSPVKKGEGTKLSAESRRKAKARAESAGRAYPNLVDNMWAAKEQKKRK